MQGERCSERGRMQEAQCAAALVWVDRSRARAAHTRSRGGQRATAGAGAARRAHGVERAAQRVRDDVGDHRLRAAVVVRVEAVITRQVAQVEARLVRHKLAAIRGGHRERRQAVVRAERAHLRVAEKVAPDIGGAKRPPARRRPPLQQPHGTAERRRVVGVPQRENVLRIRREPRHGRRLLLLLRAGARHAADAPCRRPAG
eukprot:5877715-Prymnesium_polylepis.1